MNIHESQLFPTILVWNPGITWVLNGFEPYPYIIYTWGTMHESPNIPGWISLRTKGTSFMMAFLFFGCLWLLQTSKDTASFRCFPTSLPEKTSPKNHWPKTHPHPAPPGRRAHDRPEGGSSGPAVPKRRSDGRPGRPGGKCGTWRFLGFWWGCWWLSVIICLVGGLVAIFYFPIYWE